MSSVFEEKNIAKAIFRVGLPAMFGQLTTLIYNMADTFFVSLTKEPSMIAAVTLSTPILLIIMSIACIFGMGGSSVIARLLGEKKDKYAGQTLNFCVYAMILVGIITLILGTLFLSFFAKIIGADSENITYTCDYLHYIFLGAPFIMLSNGFIHLFRSVGMIRESTIGLILGNVINIILDYILIIPLQRGAAGAALATSLGFVCSSIYFLFCMWKEERNHNPKIMLSPKYFHADPHMIKDVITIGIPGALITVLMSMANIVLNNYISIYGSDAVAAYGIAYKIDIIPIMLLVGLSQGVAPFIGFCYGAKQKKRLTDAMRFSILYGLVLGIVFTVLFMIAARPLSSIFLHEDALILQAGSFLQILCISAPLLSVINMVTSYFQALGKALHSLIITVLRNAVLFIPAVILFNYISGLNGIIAAQPIVEYILSILCIMLYLHDKKNLFKDK